MCLILSAGALNAVRASEHKVLRISEFAQGKDKRSLTQSKGSPSRSRTESPFAQAVNVGADVKCGGKALERNSPSGGLHRIRGKDPFT